MRPYLLGFCRQQSPLLWTGCSMRAGPRALFITLSQGLQHSLAQSGRERLDHRWFPPSFSPLQPSAPPSAGGRLPRAVGGRPTPSQPFSGRGRGEGNATRDCSARLLGRRPQRRWESSSRAPGAAKERSPQPPPGTPQSRLPRPGYIRDAKHSRPAGRLGPWPTPPRTSAPRGWSDPAPSANKSSGFLVRSPARLAIGRHPSLGPPNLCGPSQSCGSGATPPPRPRRSLGAAAGRRRALGGWR